MRIFTGSSHPALAESICSYLGEDLGKIELDKLMDYISYNLLGVIE